MAYWLTAFDGTSLPTNLGDRGSMDVAAGVADAPLIQLPGGKAFDPLGSTLAYRPSAQFTARVMIVSDTPSTIKSVFDAWQAKIGKVGTLTRTADSGGSTQTITARLISATVLGRTVEGSRIVRMALTFQAIALPWQGSHSGISPAAGVISGHVYTTTLTNAGNAPQTSLTIEIFAFVGAMTSVTIANTTTGHSFTYTGSVAAGQTVVIDTGARTVKNNFVGDYAHFTPPTTKEDWFQLAAGANTITYVATFGGGASFGPVFGFNDAWA